MKIALRTKIFYVLVCASLMVALALGAQPLNSAKAAGPEICGINTVTVVTLSGTGSTNPSVYGFGVKFTATLSHGAATGNVQFFDGAAALGGPIALVSGVAETPAIPQLTVLGSPHAITAVYAGDATYCTSTSAALSHSTTPKNLTVVGAVTVNPTKVYDGNVTATFTGGTPFGIVGADVVTLNQVGTYASKNVGTGKPVTPAFTLGGADKGNYTLTQPTGTFTANITQAPMTLLGVVVNNKVYDGNVTATFNLAGASVNPAQVMPLDAVSFSGAGATGIFNDPDGAGPLTGKEVAAGKAVTASGFVLTGTDAGNYLLTQPAGLTATIAAKTLTVSGLTASNRVYNGAADVSATVGGTPALVGVVPGDVVTLTSPALPFTGTFADGNAGTNKVVTFGGAWAIAGADAGNYAPVLPPTALADITPKGLTLATLSGGIVVNNKNYDGTTAATFNMGGVLALVGIIPGDAAVFPVDDLAAIGTFTSADAGIAIPVTASGWYTTTSANYFLSVQPTGLTANIVGTALNPADLEVVNSFTTAPSVTLTYNGSAYQADLHAYDPVSGLEVPGTFSNIKYNGLTAFPVDAGDYNVTADFTPSSGSNYTYDNVANSGVVIDMMRIVKVNPTLYIANNPAAFTGAPIAADLRAENRNVTPWAPLPGVFSNVTYNGSATIPSAVGTYVVRATFTPTDTNYATLVNVYVADFVIGQAATLSVTNSPVAYNGAPQAAVVVGSVPGTVSDVKYNGGSTIPTNAGTYAVTADFNPNDPAYISLNDAPAGNFVITALPVELIINGGFNSYSGTSMIPDSWNAAKFSGIDGKSTLRVEGLYSVLVQGTYQRKYIYQEILGSGTRGTPLTFQFTVRGDMVPTGGICVGQVKLYNGITLVQVRNIPCGTGTFSWTQKTVNFVAHADYTKVVVLFANFKASGNIWFDAVSLLKY